MTSDADIARATPLLPITEIAVRCGLDPQRIEPYGWHKAKFQPPHREPGARLGKLVLVTGISPTPPGEGKTTTTIGLGDAFNALGHKTIVCLREPSMGPVFGMKGGATGGGHAQVVPMDEINLHFTGDFAAIAQAHNLLAALIDNHIHQGNTLDLDVRAVRWRRVLDLNDRALRQTVIGLGGRANGYVREEGFDIVVASELMAILCLADDLSDLKQRIAAIVVGTTRTGALVRAADLKAHGAMTALLKEAIKPNLVQTLEGNPAFIHGGPFANIAHGCSSVIATRAALGLSDYTITEAGFGADLGAEKFVDIKCRSSGLRPAAAVIVATVRALKYHGGLDGTQLLNDDLEAVGRGLVNLERHATNLSGCFGLPCVVALNHFDSDRPAEVALIRERMANLGVTVVEARHWAEGSRGAIALAQEVKRVADGSTEPLRFTYRDDAGLAAKIESVARHIYHASAVSFGPQVAAQLQSFEKAGFGSLPVCIAKTPYSFSTDATRRGAPLGHTVHVREVRLAAGARFVVAIAGDVLTMPGLPAHPASEQIDVDAQGQIVGLF
ncbi:MAG: formate--tetrahydrofolate ligase [Burkholderiaceae bacterium]